MTAKAIGAHSSMHKTKVSRAVRALDERRWLFRQESAADRREEVLRLTPLGRRIYCDIIPRALAFEADILAKLGPEARSFMAALERLEAGLVPPPATPTASSGPKLQPQTADPE